MVVHSDTQSYFRFVKFWHTAKVGVTEFLTQGVRTESTFRSIAFLEELRQNSSITAETFVIKTLHNAVGDN